MEIGRCEFHVFDLGQDALLPRFIWTDRTADMADEVRCGKNELAKNMEGCR